MQALYITFSVIIVIASVLITLVVLLQNSKGGGLAANFSAPNQIMGVRKTTETIEKITWGLAIALVVLSLIATMLIPRHANDTEISTGIDPNAAMNVNATPAPAAAAPAATEAAAEAAEAAEAAAE